MTDRRIGEGGRETLGKRRPVGEEREGEVELEGRMVWMREREGKYWSDTVLVEPTNNGK